MVRSQPTSDTGKFQHHSSKGSFGEGHFSICLIIHFWWHTFRCLMEHHFTPPHSAHRLLPFLPHSIRLSVPHLFQPATFHSGHIQVPFHLIHTRALFYPAQTQVIFRSVHSEVPFQLARIQALFHSAQNKTHFHSAHSLCHSAQSLFHSAQALFMLLLAQFLSVLQSAQFLSAKSWSLLAQS